MIKLENIDVFGWEAAIRGLRNPMNSWAKSDSYYTHIEDAETLETANFEFFVGDNDLKLMQKLCKAGSDHRKFLRMINVTMDIIAPLYWWKEYDTYKVSTVTNSCSTMHRIHAKPFTRDDFSCERMSGDGLALLTEHVIPFLEDCRQWYNTEKNPNIKRIYWDDIIQTLPTSYNQRRTVQLNYEVLLNMYHARKVHKLDEWVELCKVIEILPYFEDICLNNNDDV